ncbi:MAG: cell division protein ZapB [Treponema sp.]|jgi:peptidoglycan hydrolase CwlO-like protein|nr:cell division protein ZapB [Treponema sp.]
MINLEHIRLLETRITKTIEYVKKVNEENAVLKGRLNSYNTRIEELEVLIQQFKDDQGLIEDGILSALDRLNQFEDAVESVISAENKHPAPPPASAKKEQSKAAPAPVKPAAQVKPESAETPEEGELEIF